MVDGAEALPLLRAANGDERRALNQPLVGRQICDQLPVFLDADHVQAGARAMRPS